MRIVLCLGSGGCGNCAVGLCVLRMFTLLRLLSSPEI